MNELGKELKGKILKLEGKVLELKEENKELKASNQLLDRGIREVKRFAVLIAPIHIRVLLDQARGKVVKESGFASWDDLRNSREMGELKTTIVSNHGITHDLAEFICEFTDVRRDGNEAAHTADRRDIGLAVQQKPDGAERRLLGQLYKFVFEEDLTL